MTQLIIAQTTKPVMYGLLAGAGLAASLAALLLASDLGAAIGPVVRVADPIAYGGSLLVIVVACLVAAWLPAARASRLEPMTTLRQE